MGLDAVGLVYGTGVPKKTMIPLGCTLSVVTFRGSDQICDSLACCQAVDSGLGVGILIEAYTLCQ